MSEMTGPCSAGVEAEACASAEARCVAVVPHVLAIDVVDAGVGGELAALGVLAAALIVDLAHEPHLRRELGGQGPRVVEVDRVLDDAVIAAAHVERVPVVVAARGEVAGAGHHRAEAAVAGLAPELRRGERVVVPCSGGIRLDVHGERAESRRRAGENVVADNDV